jgi:hypothetical protein
MAGDDHRSIGGVCYTQRPNGRWLPRRCQCELQVLYCFPFLAVGACCASVLVLFWMRLQTRGASAESFPYAWYLFHLQVA